MLNLTATESCVPLHATSAILLSQDAERRSFSVSSVSSKREVEDSDFGRIYY